MKVIYLILQRMCVVPKAETIPDKPFDTEEQQQQQPNGTGPPRDHAKDLFEKAKNGKVQRSQETKANGITKVDTVVTAK